MHAYSPYMLTPYTSSDIHTQKPNKLFYTFSQFVNTINIEFEIDSEMNLFPFLTCFKSKDEVQKLQKMKMKP